VKASGSQKYCVCVICSQAFSCAHHDEANIKRQCDQIKSDTMGKVCSFLCR